MNSHTISKIGTFVMAAFVCACGEGDGGVSLGEAVAVSRITSVGTAPMFTVGPNGSEALAWISAPSGGTDGRVYISIGGNPPVELRDSLGAIEAHGESPPKIAFGPDGTLYVLYVVARVEPGRRFPASALRLTASSDGGKNWSAPATVTDDETFGSHNFHSLYVSDSGIIYAGWLDGRTGKSAAYITRSVDHGRTFEPNVRVSRREACPCCRTVVAAAPDSTLYMAWRTVLPGNIRDIVLSHSNDGGMSWSEAQRVHADNWEFAGCPHAGPSVAVDSRGRVHVSWWTGKEGSAGVYYARSDDGGESFGNVQALGTAESSRPAHVQLALSDSGRTVVVVWDDGTTRQPRITMRTSRSGGDHFSDAIPLSPDDRSAGFPVVGIAGDSVIVAWSEQSVGSAKRAAESRPDMSDPNSVMGLEAVGDAEVMVRRGALR